LAPASTHILKLIEVPMGDKAHEQPKTQEKDDGYAFKVGGLFNITSLNNTFGNTTTVASGGLGSSIGGLSSSIGNPISSVNDNKSEVKKEQDQPLNAVPSPQFGLFNKP
jgi:hypothetical protein